MAELAAVFTKRNQRWADCIIENELYFGLGNDSASLSKLLENKVERIVNVADDVENFHEKEKHFQYLNSNVTDFGQDAGISRVFEEAFMFLQEGKDAHESILVHCAAGANRSATIVIA